MSKLSMVIWGAFALGFATQAPAAELTVAEWGSKPSEASRAAFWDPYTKETGTVVKDDVFTGELAKIRAQVESGFVQWDLAGIEDAEVNAGCDEGVLEPVDASKIPSVTDLSKGSVAKCGLAYYLAAATLAYNADTYKEGPKTWADFFDTSKFPGRRGLRKTVTYTMEIALLADGVPLDKVYETLATPEGQDRAFKKLDTIKDDIVWWSSGTQLVQGFVSGEFGMSVAYHGRVCSANKDNNMHLKMAWEAGHLISRNFWVIPAGAKNVEETTKFMDFALRPEPQAEFMKISGYGATNDKAYALLTDAEKECMPGTPERAPYALNYDDAAWRDNYSSLSERFNAWLAK